MFLSFISDVTGIKDCRNLHYVNVDPQIWGIRIELKDSSPQSYFK